MRKLFVLLYGLLWMISPRRMRRDILWVRDHVVHPPESLDSLIHRLDRDDEEAVYHEIRSAGERLARFARESVRAMAVVYAGAAAMDLIERKSDLGGFSRAAREKALIMTLAAVFYVPQRAVPTTMEAARAIGAAAVSFFVRRGGRLPSPAEMAMIASAISGLDAVRTITDHHDFIRETIAGSWLDETRSGG